MININKLTEKDIGRSVIYHSSHKDPERGRITSFNSTYIFVDYDNSGRGQATKPEHLEFEFKEK